MVVYDSDVLLVGLNNKGGCLCKLQKKSSMDRGECGFSIVVDRGGIANDSSCQSAG